MTNGEATQPAPDFPSLHGSTVQSPSPQHEMPRSSRGMTNGEATQPAPDFPSLHGSTVQSPSPRTNPPPSPVPRPAWASLLLATVLALLLTTPSAFAAKAFPVDQFSYFLTDYDQELARLAKDIKRSAPEIEGDIAAAEAAGNARLAAASLEQLLTQRPAESQLWLRLARQLAIAQPLNDSDGYVLPAKLVGAGLKAYTMLSAPAEEAEALGLAAQGFARREMWRPALTAYKESLKLAENTELRIRIGADIKW